MEPKLKVGTAKISILPPLDQARRLGHKGLATDIIGEICARATVLDDGIRKVAIVLLDISEFFPNITRGIRQLASQWTEIPAENILVCATHTHSSAKVIDHDDPEDVGGVMVEYESLSEKTQEYLNILFRQAASAVFLADSQLMPAKARIGEISVPGIGRPSRIRMKDGSVISLDTTVGIKDIPPQEIESESPYDDALRMVIFEQINGRPICGLANFGCHNDLALGGTTINSDFFGWAMSKLENELGDKFVFSLMSGPEGDVQPVALIEHGLSHEEAEALVPVAGNILYEGIKGIWERLEPLPVEVVSSASEEVYFPWRKPLTTRGRAYIYNRNIAGGKQDEKGAFGELQLIRIGELAILALGGEVFHEIALNLREESPLKHAWVASLCNDELTYFMPAWEHKRDLASGKMNVQLDFALTDETAEGIIYETFKELSTRVQQ